ncbi:MAG: hypothetical protein RLY93_06805 [Sumerlaeia bacterium]
MVLRLSAVFALVALFALPAQAQEIHFDSGSDGSDGELTVASGETFILNMDNKPDGIYNFSSVTIDANSVLQVEANENNTPLVILVQDDFVLNGRIAMEGKDAIREMPGQGGPGGWAGGAAGRAAGSIFPAGAGLGPGGGTARTEETEVGSAGGRNTYMKPSLVPQIGGSGGGGGTAPTEDGGAGGGGGGALTIAVSGTYSQGGNAVIDASGGRGGDSSGTTNFSGGPGSGGSVRIIASRIQASGTIDVSGNSQGSFGPTNTTRSDDGIIRLETFNLSSNFGNPSGRVYNSLPGLVFADGTGLGTLRISKVGGVDVPADAGANPDSPDVVIPSGISNPVEIEVTAENVTPGQSATIRLNYAGEGGRIIEADTAPLAGSNALSTAVAQITMDAGNGTMIAVLSTPVSTKGAVQVANHYSENDSRILIDGEVATRIERESILGGPGDRVTYITDSGRKVTFNSAN